MKKKIIPFNLEMAKKIQKGEIEGKIITRNGREVIILDYNSKKYSGYPIRIVYLDDDEVEYVNHEGLHIEESDNDEPQFKPFDKVLVRHSDKTELCVSNSIWIPGIFQYKSVNFSLYFVSGKSYEDCIPYEGNEDLVWTTNNPQ